MSNQRVGGEDLLSRARVQSGAVAEGRLRQVPSHWRPRTVRTGTRRYDWARQVTSLGAAVLAVLVLVGAGVTWAVIGEHPVPRRVPTLGELLQQEGQNAGPPPVARVGASRRSPSPARATGRAVVEKAPLGGATRRPQAPASTVQRPPQAASSKVAAGPTDRRGMVVFDQPAGDLIIVLPKSKQGPLWTPEDFGKYMRMRSRSLSY